MTFNPKFKRELVAGSVPGNIKQCQTDIRHALSMIESIVLGKSTQIKLTVCCLLARGHCLIEDLPGVGKTTLSRTLAQVFGFKFSRIQFTSDLLPADIIGVSIFDTTEKKFDFHPGPIFSNFVLADEINRATPKTQSALLEAMAENQVTVEGVTYPLDAPFFVIGTQNSLDQSGTFPLPESQLDRFMMRIRLGYPDAVAERALLAGKNPGDKVSQIKPAMSSKRFLELQKITETIHCANTLLNYVQHLIQATRSSGVFVHGLSPRAGFAMILAAKAWAMMAGRSHVEPGDVQAIFVAVAGHRLNAVEQYSRPTDTLVAELLETIAIP